MWHNRQWDNYPPETKWRWCKTIGKPTNYWFDDDKLLKKYDQLYDQKGKFEYEESVSWIYHICRFNEDNNNQNQGVNKDSQN